MPDPDLPSERVSRTAPLKRVLEAHGLTLKKRWGQHFCLDRNLLEFIVRSAGVGTEDLVLEIGPGMGHLTQVLCGSAGRVVAVEIDRGLARLLRARMEAGEFPNLDLVEGDALAAGDRLNPDAEAAVRRHLPLLRGRLRVVANLPYAVSTTLILALLESALPIAGMVVMVQKEVGERLAASPGSKAYGLSSVLAQAKADMHLRRRVPPDVFWPKPGVPSEIVVVTPRADALGGEGYLRLKEVAKGLFQHRRKTLRAAARMLERPLELPEGLEPSRRVDGLGLGDLALLAGIRNP